MCLAIPGRVEEITEDGLIRMGRVNFGGVVKRVCLDYVPEIVVGDYAIVHVGFALARVDEETALETLETFRQMGALDEEFADEEEMFARAAGRAQSSCPDGSCAIEAAGGARDGKAAADPSTALRSAQDDSPLEGRSSMGADNIARTRA
ncbi:MAG TPA: HypC/HybG/HupF family hydrogenase formation chaperone [Terracidiphilus sp.]|jgi:hydrogenase expression/formation protein HypC|nr:HypC/HybG/HupF family hydrogenase formation chaperone [Terracidiphilus sp.]